MSPTYFGPTLYEAPNLSDEGSRRKLTSRIMRDWPWLDVERDEFFFSGLGTNWTGERRWHNAASRARFRTRGSENANHVLAMIAHFLDLAALSRRTRITVLASTPEAGFVAALVRKLRPRRVRLVVRVQGQASSKVQGASARARIERTIKRAIERMALKACDLCVPMGEFTAMVAEQQGTPRNRIVIQPFPLRYDAPPGKPLSDSLDILFAGRLEKEKGVDNLLRAFASIASRFPTARLLIAGDGSQRSHLEARAAALGIAPATRFLGWVEGAGIAELLDTSRALCLPSIWAEGLGMVLVEAGLAARPVVASDIGGIRDIVVDGDNGLLVPPGDAHALARALGQVLAERAEAARMGQAGRARAERYLVEFEPASREVERRVDELFA